MFIISYPFFLLMLEGVEIKKKKTKTKENEGPKPPWELPTPAAGIPILASQVPLSSDRRSLEFIPFLPRQTMGEAPTSHQQVFQRILNAHKSARRNAQYPSEGPSQ